MVALHGPPPARRTRAPSGGSAHRLLVPRHPRIEAPAAWESIATESATSWFPEFRRTPYHLTADFAPFRPFAARVDYRDDVRVECLPALRWRGSRRPGARSPRAP